MGYNVFMTMDAEEDLRNHLLYIAFEKKNLQAAYNVNEDFKETFQLLENVAGIFTEKNDPYFKSEGFSKLHFRKHNYYLMYHLVGNDVFIDHIYHDLQNPGKV